MTPTELFYVRAICLSIIFFALVVKYMFWRNSQDNDQELRTKGFFRCIFIWYRLYDIYDSTNQDIKAFMKANNSTNRFIWTSSIILTFTLFLGK